MGLICLMLWLQRKNSCQGQLAQLFVMPFVALLALLLPGCFKASGVCLLGGTESRVGGNSSGDVLLAWVCRGWDAQADIHRDDAQADIQAGAGSVKPDFRLLHNGKRIWPLSESGFDSLPKLEMTFQLIPAIYQFGLVRLWSACQCRESSTLFSQAEEYFVGKSCFLKVAPDRCTTFLCPLKDVRPGSSASSWGVAPPAISIYLYF